ncbi:unnamed protein product [Schistocephalus solidus]|uniref:Uncharacterized protein n=1 Tax=Schistocephalus solidus TaxID=70667 RepID=A0A183S8U6_SCHSO|nr:unnamed protein product [Schistocephalus solidus]
MALMALKKFFSYCGPHTPGFPQPFRSSSHPASPAALALEPHLRDDKAVICLTIGIADRLGYQHVLSISPLDENIVQQVQAPQSRVHPRGLLPRRKAEELVGQQEMVFRTRAQNKEAVKVSATETVGTQHSLSGSVVRTDVGFEVTKDN